MTDQTLTDEEFWTEFREFLFSERKIESAKKEVEKIVKLADLDEGVEVLDMPCGVGRHSIELEERGFDVVGVDKTSTYIEEARNSDDSESIEFVQGDMKNFRRENSFDAVINWWNSFGYFESKEEDWRMMENIFASLKNGGVLVMDYYSKEIAALKNVNKHWSEKDGIYNMEKAEINDDWRTVERTWIKVEDGETREYTWNQRL